jgi:hypothetical protein
LENNVVLFIFGFLITAISTYGFSVIIELVAIKHIMDDPVKGLLVSIFVGWVLTIVWQISVFGFSLSGLATDVAGLFGAFALAYPGIRRFRRKQAEENQISQTFE